MASFANQHPIKAITNSYSESLRIYTKGEFFPVGAVYDHADFVDFKKSARL